MALGDYKIREFLFNVRARDTKPYRCIKIDLGPRGQERKVAPSGDVWYWDLWARNVEITISPNGRRIHVHVDGVNITPELIARLKAEQE